MQPAYLCPELLKDFVENVAVYSSEPYHCYTNASMPDVGAHYNSREEDGDVDGGDFDGEALWGMIDGYNAAATASAATFSSRVADRLLLLVACGVFAFDTFYALVLPR